MHQSKAARTARTARTGGGRWAGAACNVHAVHTHTLSLSLSLCQEQHAVHTRTLSLSLSLSLSMSGAACKVHADAGCGDRHGRLVALTCVKGLAFPFTTSVFTTSVFTASGVDMRHGLSFPFYPFSYLYPISIPLLLLWQVGSPNYPDGMCSLTKECVLLP